MSSHHRILTGTDLFAEAAENIPDMRTEAEEFIAQWGREAYLRKRTDQRCRCFDPLTEEADLNCPSCSGLGFVYLDHKVRIRRGIMTRKISGAYRKVISDFGVLGVSEIVVYMVTDLYPSIHDWVVEVVTDGKGNIKRPPLIENAWDINEVVDLRDAYGRVAYWELRCRSVATGK